MLVHCFDEFRFYRDRFQAAGVHRADVTAGDPVETLGRLPTMAAGDLVPLAQEALSVSDAIVVVDTSSGTTGPRKLRFISYQDDQRDHAFLAELFAVAGVGPSDRVACLDTDPVNLMVSLAKGFETLGVSEAYCLSVGADFASAASAVEKLRPTVLVSVPSILERLVETFAKHSPLPPVARVIYVGEAMAVPIRHSLETSLGAEVYAYYGASETAALGIECQSHAGVHFFTSHNLAELLLSPDVPPTTEIVVTTLHNFAQPLLRYRLGDRVLLRSGPCACGLAYPRIDVLGRPEESVSLLGSKISYGAIRSSAYAPVGAEGDLQVIVSRRTREVLTLVLPDTISERRQEIMDSVLAREPDLEFLRDGGFLEIAINFVEPGHFYADRKLKRVVDTRRVSSPSSRGHASDGAEADAGPPPLGQVE
jgi:phenylacetate-CoA ligase